MIKLLDITSQKNGKVVATLFSDTKAEVPETGVETTVTDLPLELDTGSLLITAYFDVAFLDSNGNWIWKGDEPPVPPAEPVTVTLTYNGTGSVAYINENGEYTLDEISSGTSTTITCMVGTIIIEGLYNEYGDISTTASYEKLGTNEDSANMNYVYIVKIEDDTTIGVAE